VGVASDSSFTITCGDGCKYAGMKRCLPMKCGKFFKDIGMVVDEGWSLDREYVHGEYISLSCLPSYAVEGGSCAKTFTVECWEGEFRTREAFLPTLPRCNAVVCQDENGEKNTCGEGSCPIFGTVIDESLSQVQLITDKGRISGEALEVVNGGTLIVSCNPSMSPNPMSIYPYQYSDCPVIPSHGGMAEFQTGEYPVFCDDCDYVRNYYCAIARCPVSLIPVRPHLQINRSQTLIQDGYVTIGGFVTASCSWGYTFNRVTEQPLNENIGCRQNCVFAEPPACVAKSCGTFSLPPGTRVVPRGESVFSSSSPTSGAVYASAGWSVDQEYVHGDVFQVVCVANSRVLGTQCMPSYDVICDNGKLMRRDDASANFAACEHVDCLHLGLNAAGCNLCPAYAPPYGDVQAADWEPRTQRVHGETVQVRCKEGFRAGIVELEELIYPDYNCSVNNSILIATPDNYASCHAASSTYDATCRPTGWQSKYRCLPITCPLSPAHILSTFIYPDRVQSVKHDTHDQAAETTSSSSYKLVHVDGVETSLLDKVVLDKYINITCREGYRAGSHDVKARRWQLLRCQSSCDFVAPAECLAVECRSKDTPSDATAMSPRMIGGAVVPVMYYEERFEMFHLDSVSFACNTGYTYAFSSVSARSMCGS
jgi:hypothetical protein